MHIIDTNGKIYKANEFADKLYITVKGKTYSASAADVLGKSVFKLTCKGCKLYRRDDCFGEKDTCEMFEMIPTMEIKYENPNKPIENKKEKDWNSYWNWYWSQGML